MALPFSLRWKDISDRLHKDGLKASGVDQGDSLCPGKEDKFCQKNIQSALCMTIRTAEKLITLTSVLLSGKTKTV